MEQLLTTVEIAEILAKASIPEYQTDNLYFFTSKKLDIAKVSKKGLIFIHGDEHTGMEHIQVRHSITSRKLFEKDGRFDNPTKFTLAPVEYPFVADLTFAPVNLNTEKNKHPDLFDIYEGDFAHSDCGTYSYVLILYKDTKIVHTFFLNNNTKPFNKKIKLPIRQGWSGGNHDLQSGIQEYTIKYLDIDKTIRFAILLRCLPSKRLEKWYLTTYDANGIALFTHFLHEEKDAKHYRVTF